MKELGFYLIRSEYASWTVIGEEVAVVNLSNDYSYRFNHVGSLIWKMADGKNRLVQIVDEVVKQYRIDKARAQRDVVNFCKDLVKAKLARFSRQRD
jgi:DNA-binding ferritin-like protein (Dps family)